MVHQSEKTVPSECMSEKPSDEFARGPDGRLGSDISNPFNFKHEVHVGAQVSNKTGDWVYTNLPAEWAQSLAAGQPDDLFARAADGRLGRDISLPFNFKHEIHVYGHFSGFPGTWKYDGLPPSWAEALESQPSPNEETTPLLGKIRIKPRNLRVNLNIHPVHHLNRLRALWAIKFHPHPEEDENISQPFNVKHETHADSKYTSSFHTALILAAEDSWQSVLALSQRQCHPKKRNQRRSWRRQRERGMRPTKPSDAGDENISFPWNFQHIIHVDQDFNGLPPSWAHALGIRMPRKKCCSHICTAS